MTCILFSLSYFIPIAEIIIMSLSFVILMEVVRTIYEYIANDNHRVKVRYIIDGSILFSLREFFVGLVMLKTSLILGIIIVSVSLISTGALVFYRKKIIQSSPDTLEPPQP